MKLRPGWNWFGGSLAACAVALLAGGCGPREKTSEERMNELMAEQDRQLGGFDATQPGGNSGAARGPSGEILNWRVTVTQFTVEDDQRDSLGVLWKYADANVRVTGGMTPRENGLRLGVAGANFRAELDAAGKNAQMSSKNESMLVVMKGRTGLLTVGQTRFVPAFIYNGRTIGGVLLKTDAVQSLLVRPETAPDGLVQVSLTPQFSRIEGYNDIVLTELTTTVLVKPGQSLVIGGSDTSENQVAGSLFSHVRGNKNAKTLLVLRVDGM